MKALSRTLLFFLFCLFSIAFPSMAQEGNIWYFGFNAGLNFNTVPPQVLTNGALSTQEGCASISNKNGNVMFYTDGIMVYNRNHQAMPNGTGLLGNSSSTQSAIIIPNPGDSNLYYIFTSDCFENDFVNGYNYSVVDMRLSSGLGDVTSQKNIRLYDPSTERLTAVKAANGIDYWVITKGLNNNRFSVYKIDCNGLNINPVISDIGTVHTYGPLLFSGSGALKVSPNGKKICVAITGPIAMAELFDFDNNTGRLSNPIQLLGYPVGFISIYGIEFSPDSKMLYTTVPVLNEIHQYDISSGNPTTIEASKFTISTGSLYPAGLQLTPDNRIFIASNMQPNLSSINNPNTPGINCNYVGSSIFLSGKLSSTALPAYIASFFDVSNHIDFTSSFIDCHINFNGTTNLVGTFNWSWDFGDGTLATGQNVAHSYRQIGTYSVTLKVRRSTSPCNLPVADSFVITKPITINNIFSVDYNYRGACVNQAIQFNDNSILTVGAITGRTWDFGDGSPSITARNPIHTFANPGAYDVKLVISTNGICNADSIVKRVYIDTKPVNDFIPSNGCINQSIQFNDNSTNNTGIVDGWKWFFGDGDSSINKNPAHTYLNYGNYNVQLQVTSQHGCSSTLSIKPIVVDSKPLAVFDYQFPCLDKPTIFNNSSSNIFGSIISTDWAFGDNSFSALNSPTHQYVTPGNYTTTITLKTTNGCNSILAKTVNVIRTVAYAGRDTFAIYDQVHQLKGTGGGTYLWAASTNLDDANIANPKAILLQDERFLLTITSIEGCLDTDDIFIKVIKKTNIYVPTAFTPNNDGFNDVLRPYLVGIDHLNYFKIYNRYGQLIFFTKEPEKGWDGKINGSQQPPGGYAWFVEGVDVFGKIIYNKGTSLLIR